MKTTSRKSRNHSKLVEKRRQGEIMPSERRQTTQSIAWFWDLERRELLDLDPPYQRRSVWSQSYKDYFIDTIILDYPAPAVFLFEDIDEDGDAQYSVVDGKQRLSTIFEFLRGDFSVSDTASISRFRGLSFSDLPVEAKRSFYNYQFSIEVLPSTDEGTLNNIFDRINRNVARLTPQELRHARFDGIFANTVESLTTYVEKTLPSDFPRIAAASKRQMKDAEFVVQLLLLAESGVQTYSQEDLDQAYSDRNESWDDGPRVETEFRETVLMLGIWADTILQGPSRRLRNQADFYALFGATLNLRRLQSLPSNEVALGRLDKFMLTVSNESGRQDAPAAKRYFEAARSASNDVAQRRDRIDILQSVLGGEE